MSNEKHRSAWTANSNIPHFKTLKEDIKTNVLIIGGGMAGVLTAYFLERAGIDYVLVEGKTIGNGITKNTTAKITSQHGLIYDQLLKSGGYKTAKLYYMANEHALQLYKELTSRIDCDFEEKDAYVYSLDDKEKIMKEVEAVKSIGFSAEFVQELPLPFTVAGAVKFKNQAQFNPLKFIQEICTGLNIYEHTFVKELVKNKVITDYGSITADKIIVTTHFPFINKHGSYFIKMYQHRSYVIALENAPNINGMYVDEQEKGMSFRNYQDLLLIGGGDHRTGKKGGSYQELEAFAQKYYPNAKQKYAWATQDCMSLDSVPYIGQYSKSTPNLFVATGFNKWGMTTSMVSAMILSDLVIGKPNEYAEVFSPHRSILKPQLFVNGFEAVTSLLTPTTKRCPHLGCALKYNKAEHSWDCPCHGSRFDERGNLIDNPATGSINIE